jgi:hypothetical protein
MQVPVLEKIDGTIINNSREISRHFYGGKVPNNAVDEVLDSLYS